MVCYVQLGGYALFFLLSENVRRAVPFKYYTIMRSTSQTKKTAKVVLDMNSSRKKESSL